MRLVLALLFSAVVVDAEAAGPPYRPAPPLVTTLSCNDYAAVGRASCQSQRCFNTPEVDLLFESKTNVVKRNEHGDERYCFVQFHNYYNFVGRKSPWFPTQVCIVARAKSQIGVDRKAEVTCDVTIPRYQHMVGQSPPPGSRPYDYNGKINGVFPFEITHSPEEITAVIPFEILISELNAIEDRGWILYKVSVDNTRFEAFQTSRGPVNQRIDLRFDVALRSLAEDMDCKVRLNFSVPAAEVAENGKVGLFVQGVEAGCDASGVVGHAIGLDAFVADMVRSAIGGQILNIIGAAIEQGEVIEWAEGDPELLALLKTAWIGGAVCTPPHSGLCVKISFQGLDRRRSYLLGKAAKRTAPADLSGLSELRDRYRQISPRMQMPDGSGYAFPAKHRPDGYDDGDMAIFGGLLCLSGEAEGCELVRRSQGSNGQFWRSPARANGKTDDQFSGDQFKGVAAYWAKTSDYASVGRYLDAVSKKWSKYPSENTFLIKMFNGCDDDPGGKCNLIEEEWRWLIVNSANGGIEGKIPAEMRDYVGIFGDPVAAYGWKTSLNKLGYRTHLTAVEVYIARKLGIKDSKVDDAAQILAGRQPKNPFFVYLHLGKDQIVADLVRQKCVPDPQQPEQSEWAWERVEENEAWKKSMGWDCIFMLNNLLN